MENPNFVVPTAIAGTSDNRAASTKFVQTAVGSISTALVVGSTVISGGSNGNLLFDNAGVLGETTAGAALVSVVTYSSTQTITIPTGATKAFIRMWGGTGGSGGVASAGGSGGSGAAGYLEKYLTGLTPGNTLAYTQGAAGAAGAATPTNGGNGTASTLASGNQTITTLTANGSNGSLSATNNASVGTAGGTATNGDVNITGQNGSDGLATTDNIAANPQGYGGHAGDSLFAPGANGVGGAVAGKAGRSGGLVIFWFT
jgi:hypothetical protein